jgi:hypothetical protein
MTGGALVTRGDSVASRGEPYRGEPGSASGDGSCSRHGGARAPSEGGRGDTCGDTRGESRGELVEMLRAGAGEVLHLWLNERPGMVGRSGSGEQFGEMLIAVREASGAEARVAATGR